MNNLNKTISVLKLLSKQAVGYELDDADLNALYDAVSYLETYKEIKEKL